MTTIAFKDGRIAADSLACQGYTVIGESEKIRRIQSVLYGRGFAAAAGRAQDAEDFYEWLAVGGKKPVFDESFNGIFCNSGGATLFDFGLTPLNHSAPFFAIGSGMDFALGAMAAGASARQAVKIACNLDAYSGGKIITRRADRQDG